MSNTTFSQYPTTKRIKGDSVVIMTVGQADTINLLYRLYNDSITELKNSITTKRLQYDSINKEICISKDSFYNWKWKYEANRKSYFDREKDYYKTEKIHEASKIVLVGILLLQFATISQLQHKIDTK